jgi:HAD superfamily hydrolase (TIGR01549 family)
MIDLDGTVHEPERSTVLLDLDGTLVDTNYLHTSAWYWAMQEAGHDVPAAWIHHRIGMGGEQLLDELIGPGDHEHVTDGWRRRFRAVRSEARALAGAGALVRAVAGRGAQVVIASSSEQEDVDALLALLDADDAISAVTTSADVGEAKPAPDVFEVALAKVGGRPSEAIAVGDSVWDVRAAARAGIPCSGVLTGGISAAALLGEGAVEVRRDPLDLAAHLDDGALGRLLGG